MNRDSRRAAERKSRRLRATGAAFAAGSAALATTAIFAGPAATPAGAAVEVANLNATGGGSLRDAINTAADGDTITFAAGLTGTILLNNDDLDIAKNLTIQGPGSAVITINGDAQSRIFDIDSGNTGSFTVTISGLTITNGRADNADGDGDWGGAIRAAAADHVTVSDSVVSGSTATDQGGGFANFYEDSSITIVNSLITGNHASDGGGLYFESTGTITNSVISGNEATGDGGGVYQDANETETATLTIVGSTISGNTAGGKGGGVYVDDSGGVSIQGSTITGNHAPDGDGGGIDLDDVDGDITITTSTISGNDADGFGGGIGLKDTDNGAGLTVSNSTISGNTAGEDGGGIALYSPDGNVKIFNSTISGNIAEGDGGGIAFYDYNSVHLYLIHDTITANTATTVGGVLFGGQERERATDTSGRADKAGSNDAKDAKSTAELIPVHVITGTILAKNTGTFDLGGEATANSNHSLLGTVDPDMTVNDIGGTITGKDPLLGPLADNGGPTFTQALLSGSPAIDAGENPVATFPGNDNDQRGDGYPRVVAGIVDIGAYEVQPIVVVPTFTG